MIGGSSAPYLARTPCVPLFCTSFNRLGNKERFRLPGAGGGSFLLYGGTFARSYSVSIYFNSLQIPPNLLETGLLGFRKSEDCSRASTRKICPKRKGHEKATKKPRTSNEKGPNTVFLDDRLGEGKWGRKKCRRIPKCEGDWQGRVPKCSLPRKSLQNKRFGAPNF